MVLQRVGVTTSVARLVTAIPHEEPHTHKLDRSRRARARGPSRQLRNASIDRRLEAGKNLLWELDPPLGEAFRRELFGRGFFGMTGFWTTINGTMLRVDRLQNAKPSQFAKAWLGRGEHRLHRYPVWSTHASDGRPHFGCVVLGLPIGAGSRSSI